MKGEDGRPASGPGAMEGHMQNTVRGLNTVVLQRDVFGGKSKFRFLYCEGQFQLIYLQILHLHLHKHHQD